MGDGFELEDNTLAAEYSEELEFGNQREKDLSDRLLSTAEKAADIAVRALGGLVEAAALVGFLHLCMRPNMNLFMNCFSLFWLLFVLSFNVDAIF